MKTITQYKHEIMWWMSRLTIMMTSLFLSFTLAAQAYAAEILSSLGSNTKLPLEPIVISAA